MIIEVFARRTSVSRLVITLIHFVILNLLLGSMSCDDDSPDVSAICYVTKITPVSYDPRVDGYTKFTYDNLDRITFAEFKQHGSICSPTLAEVIWEDDSVKKIIYTESSGSACNRSTREITILYANNLVTKIGDYEFTYNNDLSLSEVIYYGSIVQTFQYNSDRNVQSIIHNLRKNNTTTEYSYDKNPNYLSPLIKALGNQPALAYFLFSGVTALSANNVLTEKDNNGVSTSSYVFNDKRFAVEQYAAYEAASGGQAAKQLIRRIEYGVCK